MSEIKPMRVHANIVGRVQGVGFRAFVVDKANLLGVTGWVRNRRNDTVEVLAEGNYDALEKLLVALREGPRASFVANVDLEWQAATGEFHYFSVWPTT